MSDFLGKFQKSAFTIQNSTKRTTGKTQVLFMLSVDDRSGATVTVVNEKGEPVEPD